MTDPWAAAQAVGVAVLDRSYTSDGDAYTVAGVSRPLPTGKPVLDSLNPDTFNVGDPSVAVHAIGSGFTRDCRIVFAGHAEPTDFHTDTDLSTFLNAASWQGADIVQVSVYSEQRGSSAALPFTITAARSRSGDDVPDGTISDVLAWVDDDPRRAEQALQAEETGQQRSTLISRLEELAG